VASTKEDSVKDSLDDFPRTAPVVELDEVNWSTFDETRPMVIRGAMTRAIEKWTDEWLLQRFGSGSHRVTLDSRPALRGTYEKKMSLEDYLGSMESSEDSDEPPEYLFQTWMERHFDAAADLLDDLDVPEPILSLGVAGKWRFFVGPPGSGTLPHNHYNAINALARGRKRWAIYQGTEPGGTRRLLAESYQDYDSGSQARDWFVNDCPALRSRRNVHLWELAQEPGDVVFIPGTFIHAIVNLEPVVGFGAELFPSQEEQDAVGPMRPRRAVRSRGPMPGRRQVRGPRW
jgi:hypothetical protein